MERLRDLWRHRALVGVLVTREVKARYRGSVLGFFWSLLNPLLMLAVYTLVFQLLLPNRSPSTSPYALFLFCGLLPWNWLSSAITDAASSLLTHGALLRKILFPAEVLPAVAVLAQGVHFLLALPVLLAALVAGALGSFGTKVPLGWPLLQVIPLLVLQALLLLGIGLFLAALTVHFRDVKDLLQTVLSVLFFATPILYTLNDLPKTKLTRLLALNPFAPIFAGWHDALFYGRVCPPETWAAAAAISVAAFAVGFAFFDRLRDSFPEAV
jgi:ABC-type polysaccharide/polyol phosphate export systems, permease component